MLVVFLLGETSTLSKVGVPLLGAGLVFLMTWFWRYRTRVEAAAAADTARITALEKADGDRRVEMAELRVQISPLWAAVQSKIAKDLTHPHKRFAEMDQLLRELESLTLTVPRHARLLVLLEERIQSVDPAVSQDERESAQLLEIVMRKVIGEAQETANSGEIAS